MNPLFKAMQPKKKRPVDPNAPPRPNLLNHEKRLKDSVSTIEQLQAQNIELKRRLDILENKLANQTAYMSQMHQVINRIASKIKA